MQIVSEDQSGYYSAQVIQLWVILLERGAEFGIGVGFFINREQQIETVEQKVAAATRWVENSQFPWVFLGAVRM